MKRGTLLSVVLVLAIAIGVLAAGDSLLFYEGMVTKPDGETPLAPGTYEMTFRIFDELTEGEELWATVPRDVEVGDYGLIREWLGVIRCDIFSDPFDAADDGWRFLEIQVADDKPNSPRTPITCRVGTGGLKALSLEGMMAKWDTTDETLATGETSDGTMAKKTAQLHVSFEQLVELLKQMQGLEKGGLEP